MLEQDPKEKGGSDQVNGANHSAIKAYACATAPPTNRSAMPTAAPIAKSTYKNSTTTNLLAQVRQAFQPVGLYFSKQNMQHHGFQSLVILGAIDMKCRTMRSSRRAWVVHLRCFVSNGMDALPFAGVIRTW